MPSAGNTTPRRDGSEWTLTLDIIPAGRTNAAPQKAAMAATFRTCCASGTAAAAGAVNISAIAGAAGAAVGLRTR
jgi:hypothetical protein